MTFVSFPKKSIAALFVILAIPCSLLSGEPKEKAEPQSIKPLEYNRAQLVEMAVEGEIAPPVLSDPPYRISPHETIGVYPGIGSITYR